MAQLPLITLSRVSKSKGLFKNRKLLLKDLSGHFERRGSYAILGTRGSGKTTLINLIAGLSRPSTGRVIRRGLVTPPLASTTTLAGYKTGRELAYFLSRIYQANGKEVVETVRQDFGLGDDLLDTPISSLAAEDRTKISYAVGYSMPADLYLFDGDVQYGDDTFRDQCRRAFEVRRSRSATIFTTRNPKRATEYADLGCLLHRGQLIFYPSVEDAVDAFHEAELRDQREELDYVKKLIIIGERGRAEDYLRETLAANGGSDTAYLMLAELALREKNFGQAAEAAQSAIDGGTDLLRAHVIAARARLGQGDIIGAVRQLEAIPHESRNDEIDTLLGHLYDKVEDHSAASEIWLRLAAGGDRAAGKRVQASLTKAAAWDRLTEFLHQQLADTPNDLRLLEAQFNCLSRQERWEEANEILASTARIDPQKALGLIYTISKTDQWEPSIPMILRIGPMITGLRRDRTVEVLEAMLRRRSVLLRRNGTIRESEDVDTALLAIQGLDQGARE